MSIIRLIGVAILFFLGLQSNLQAQQIKNVDFQSDGQKINVTYDLIDSQSRLWNIHLLLSTDNGNTWYGPLTYVSGDVGRRVVPGTGKKIIWDAQTERTSLYGPIKFKVEGSFMEEQKKPVVETATGFTDARDGKTYRSVQINRTTWMAQNLDYTPPSGSWCYRNEPESCAKFGRLYDWATATSSHQGSLADICPAGWHLATDQEWQDLVNYLGTNPAQKLKSINYWNDKGTDNRGFSALPSGYKRDLLTFVGQGSQALFWTSKPFSSTTAYSRSVLEGNSSIFRRSTDKTYGLSVRCVKDQ